MIVSKKPTSDTKAAPRIMLAYGVTAQGNFEGANILHFAGEGALLAALHQRANPMYVPKTMTRTVAAVNELLTTREMQRMVFEGVLGGAWRRALTRSRTQRVKDPLG
ncbi:MAG TPA: hypothetical protein VFD70_15430 [Anaerolineae bacterium]|nr:hypothetical protein [Anaerolineae bacterium]